MLKHLLPFPAKGPWLPRAGQGLQRPRRGDAGPRLRGVQRLHLRLRPDGGGEELHHDGQAGRRGQRGNHTKVKNDKKVF